MKFISTNNPEKFELPEGMECTGFGVRKDNGQLIIFASDGPTFKDVQNELKTAVICVHHADDPPSLFSIIHDNGEIVMYMLEGKNERLKLIIEGLLKYMTPMQFILTVPELNPSEPVAIGIDELCFVIGGTVSRNGKVTIYESNES